jgi:hypothetical protein
MGGRLSGQLLWLSSTSLLTARCIRLSATASFGESRVVVGPMFPCKINRDKIGVGRIRGPDHVVLPKIDQDNAAVLLKLNGPVLCF